MEAKVDRPPELLAEIGRLETEEWSNESFPLLTKALAESDAALALRAAAAPDPQAVTTLSVTTPFPELSPVIAITDLLRASAARMAAGGDLAHAYAELETALQFAQIITRGGVLVQELVAMACDTQICASMRAIAQRHALPSEAAVRATANLLKVSSESEPLAGTIREETRALPQTIEMAFRKPASLFPSEARFSAGS